MNKTPLFGKTLTELEEIVQALKGKPLHAKAIADGLYKKNISSFETIKTIPKALKESLYLSYCIGKYPPIQSIKSIDDTKKYLFVNNEEQRFESVFMPGSKRNTLCISSQSGCRMGCDFCLTGKIGYNGNLSASDIVNQLYSIPDFENINRLVIMGMGEPFDNFLEVKKAVEIITSQWGLAFGAANITVSSVGLIEPLSMFLDNPFCNLAISLNNPIPEERKKLMPIENSNPIAEVIDLIKRKPLKKPLRLSFEYVALAGINTSSEHAISVANLLKDLTYHLNIICWNNHLGSTLIKPSEIELNAFISCLNNNGVLTTVRQSRGQDIGAACGQMAGQDSMAYLKNN